MDPEYSAEWPGLWGHLVSDQTDEQSQQSLADLALEISIEEALIRRAERKKQDG